MTTEEALLSDLRRVIAQRDALLADKQPDMFQEMEALRAGLQYELTKGVEEIRRLSEQSEASDRDLFAHLGAALEVNEVAAVLEPSFGGVPFRTSLGGVLLLAAFTLRDRVAVAERAACAELVRAAGCLADDGECGSVCMVSDPEVGIRPARTSDEHDPTCPQALAAAILARGAAR